MQELKDYKLLDNWRWITHRPACVSLAAIFVGGFSLGTLVKFAEKPGAGIDLIGQISSHFGLWIVIAALVAAWSRSRQIAALHVAIFMLAMLAAYYLVSWHLFGVSTTNYFIGWTVIALLLSPLFTIVTWPSRQQGWLAAFAAALPIGLLLAEAFSFRLVLYLRIPPFVFDIGAAFMLLAILPRSNMQRMRVLALIPPTIILASGFLYIILPCIYAIPYKFGLRL